MPGYELAMSEIGQQVAPLIRVWELGLSRTSGRPYRHAQPSLRIVTQVRSVSRCGFDVAFIGAIEALRSCPLQLPSRQHVFFSCSRS